METELKEIKDRLENIEDTVTNILSLVVAIQMGEINLK